MQKKCLLLETKDKRKFFTDSKNYKELIEFSNNFGAGLSIVTIDNPTILSLNELAPALCSSNFKYSAEFKVKPRKIIKVNSSIKEYIRNLFLKKEIVNLQQIANKFKNYNLTLACFCQHISKTKASLISEGHTIVKIGGGKYKLIK
jgi:hypothetical protein